MMILGIDPGLATGIARLIPELDEFDSGIIEGGLLGFVDWFESHLEATAPTHVVIEAFTIMESTAQKTRQYDALFINGYVEARCYSFGIDFTRQQVSNVKNFATNAKLKNLGWYRPGAGHDNDAARHVLAYISKFGWAQDIMRRAL